jgi:hypothetical protein
VRLLSRFPAGFPAAALLAAFALPSALWSAPVYDNSATDTLLTYVYSVGPYSEIGDAVTLGGTDRTLTDASVQFFNLGAAGGTFDATLRLYSLSQNPLGSFQNTGLTIGGTDILTVSFSGLNLTVPDAFIFTVGVSNVAAGLDLGLNAFEPPGVGQSDSESIIVDGGTGLAESLTARGQGNLYFVANAITPGPHRVPEPSAISLVALTVALGSTVVRRR